MTTGAARVVEALEQAGVEVCFGLPGVHNLALWEALRESPIRLVGVRHEQTAVYAADGYARATGRLGVALTTTGPGAANTLGAVGEAWASRSPVLIIATDIPSTLRRPGVYRGALHETTDQGAMFAPVVDSIHRARRDRPVAATAREALRSVASRPVYLEIATDLLSAEAATDAPSRAARTVLPFHGADRLARDAVRALEAAQRPLLWAGRGARGAAAQVGALAEALAAPVLTTYGGRGLLGRAHPCDVGMPPHVEPAGRLWDEADVVVAIGTDLDGMNTQNWAMPQPPMLIAVNTDPVDAAKNYRPDLILEDLDELTPRARPREDVEALAARLRAVRAQACRQLDSRALRFLDAISFAVPDDGIIVCDMCIPGYWIAGFHGFARPAGLQYPMGWGTLGYAFPAALGAALGAGAGPVVSISGDGGFLFAPGELATMVQESVALTAVVVDDGGYGMLRYDQVRTGHEPHGVDLRTPDFEALAAAFGVRAETVDGLEDDFGEALARHVEDPQPSLLVARAEALVPPPTTSPNWYRARAA